MLLGELDVQIKRSEHYVSKNSARLEELTTSRRYDELANILMANLHVKPSPQSGSIKLFDFYAEQEIEIKINPHLTLQRNAENYYRKAKNQSIELDRLQENINTKKEYLRVIRVQYQQIQAIQDPKELKQFASLKEVSGPAKPVENLPYLTRQVDGYEVWIGKNAKSNDLMTLKFAKKNDLWLHAKDVAGSHVVIKSKGSEHYPKDTIERVAQIAAWNSKRKHDTLCPVIYTLKKYVNKI